MRRTSLIDLPGDVQFMMVPPP